MISFLIFVLIFSVNVSYAEDCHIHPQRENCLDPHPIKRGGRLLNAIGDLSDDFENIARNIWIDDSQTGIRWRIENSKSPREPNNPAPTPSVGENYMRVDRGATVFFGVAVLRSQIFRIPSSTNVSISFDFWIRSKWPQFTNLELHFNENGNERLLVSLSKYSDINIRNWVTSPEFSLRSQSESSNTSLVFYAYCGMDVEDAVVIDNIRLIDESFTCERESKTLTCPTGQVIIIDFANYGRTTHPVCIGDPVRDIPNNCSTASHTNQVGQLCNGQSSCVVPATNSFFGDTCPQVFKYLQIKYHCA